MAAERFGIVVTAKMRHAALWDAAKKLGSAAALARWLGLTQTTVGGWINLRSAPSLKWLETEAGQAVGDKLLLLCGQTPSDLWPVQLRAAVKGGEVGKRLERRAEVDLRALAEGFRERLTLPAPDDVMAQAEASAGLSDLLRRLPDRQRKVIAMRFGLDGYRVHTLEQAGEAIGVCRERVREIQGQALRKLREYGCELSPSVRESFGFYVVDEPIQLPE